MSRRALPRCSSSARSGGFSTANTPPGDASDNGAFEAGGYVRLTSFTRTNNTAHPQLSKDLTTGPGPAYYLQRRAALGTGTREKLPGPVSGTSALLPFADTTATNAHNFYRAGGAVRPCIVGRRNPLWSRIRLTLVMAFLFGSVVVCKR